MTETETLDKLFFTEALLLDGKVDFMFEAYVLDILLGVRLS